MLYKTTLNIYYIFIYILTKTKINIIYYLKNREYFKLNGIYYS